MAYCSNCGHQLADDTKFCVNCGAQAKSASSPKERRTVFDGEIHKCPHCGEVLKAFEAVCPSCKFELRDVRRSTAVKELIAKIEELDSKKNEESLITSIKRRLDGSKLSPLEEQKISLISNFPIPNTKEDILEFMILSSSHIYRDSSSERSEHDELLQEKLTKAWKTKFEQAYEKAKICLSRDEDRAEIEQLYYKTILAPMEKRNKTTKYALLISFVSVVAITALILCIVFINKAIHRNDYKKNVEAIVWDGFVLGDNIPDFGITEAEILLDTEDNLMLIFYDVEKFIFDSYILKCKEFGYSIEAEESNDSFIAYNSNGYYLNADYSDYNEENRVTINLDRPKKQNPITWSSIKLMSKLPEPPSAVGEIYSESKDYFAVYILGVDKVMYDEYVNLCMEKGFNKDYKKYDETYNASNFWGYELTLEYKGFNTMYLRISKD